MGRNEPPVLRVGTDWHPEQTASKYALQVSESPDFSILLVEEENIIDTSYLVSTLDYETNYYWRISATNDNGKGSWTPAWSFTTQMLPAPGLPVLVSPVDGAVNLFLPVTLKWNNINVAETYHLQVSQYSDFSSTLINISDMTDTSITLEDLETEKSYYWRVRAANETGTGDWSETRNFTTRSNKIALSITDIIVEDKVYDGNTIATLSGGILTGVVAGDDVTLNNGSGVFTDKNVGTDKAVTATGYSISGTDASNYSFSQPSNITADITAAPLTIKAEDGEKGQDQEDPVFAVKYSGFISGDDSSVVTGLTIEREPGESPGTYVITPSNASASNYDIKYEKGELTIRASTSVLRRNYATSEKTNGPVKGVFIGPNPVSIKKW